MTTEQTYPAWTRDGTRPWHHRTHDREIGGRTVRVWLGSYADLRRRGCVGDAERWTDAWSAIKQPHLYWTGYARDAVSERHVGECSRVGWIGIAYLPADPRPATAAWPGWRHVAHAADHWTDLLPEYEHIVALPDDGLAALLEG